MVSRDQLAKLLAETDSHQIERTVSLSDFNQYGEAVTAFANDLADTRQPGFLLIGINDRGELAGLRIDDAFLAKLGGLRSDGLIMPLPSIQVERFSFEAGDVAVVEVQPSSLPPVRYKGRAYIRVGPRKAIASEQDERRLVEKRISKAKSFDALPCLEADLANLRVNLFQLEYLPKAVSAEVLAENHRSIQHQLASLRFFDVDTNCPTHAGILLFGDNPSYFLPGAYLQFVRFSGPDRGSEVLAESRIMGNLTTAIPTLEELLNLILEKRPVPVSILREETVHSYPVAAIRELVVNALMHRNYESTAPVQLYQFPDHLEIYSPGGLYGEATIDNFPEITSYRNPVIAESFRVLGHVNRFGRGVARAKAELLANGNGEPRFEFLGGAIRVHVCRNPR
jgi:ATP-dependent DNA helicase RecG